MVSYDEITSESRITHFPSVPHDFEVNANAMVC